MKRIFLFWVLLLAICAGCTSLVEPLPDQPLELVKPAEQFEPELSIPGLIGNEVQTLLSLQKIDDHPLYTMHYLGNYPVAGSADLVIHKEKADWACTLFAALPEEGQMFYGRNFDWDYSPVLLLYADPPDGYASVSVVDLAYFEFSADQVSRLDQLDPADLTALLDAPWWPFDGINQHGLVIGMAAVAGGNMAIDPQKETAGSLEIMRIVLDRAKNVDQALEIFNSYNIDMEGGPDLHYLIADRTGRAVLIEFYQGEMVVLPNQNPWHLATNFLCSSGSTLEGRCWRFDAVFEKISQSGGLLSPDEGMELLQAVSQPITQWSVLYGISTSTIEIVVGQDYDQVYSFDFGLGYE